MNRLFPEDMGPIARLGFGALLLALALAPGIGGYPSGVAYGADLPLNALRALVCVAALCLAFDGSERPRLAAVFRISAFAICVAAGLTWLSLLLHSSFLTSTVLLFAMLPAALNWLCYALVFVVCARLVRRRETLIPIIGALAVGAAWTAISGAREYGQYVQMHEADQRISATFFDPNFAAGFLALTLPIAASWFCAVKERLGVLLLGVLTALIFGALVATGSRAGLGIAITGTAVAFALALISGRRAHLLPWSRIAALIIACGVLGFGFRGPLTTRVAGEGARAAQQHSGAFRVWTWRGALSMAKANPVLGTGPGTFATYYPIYAKVEKTDLAHESYLQLAAEQGFPALVAAVAAIAAASLGGVATLLRRQSVVMEDQAGTDNRIGARLLLCGLLGGILVGVARSIFDSEWSILGNALPFWAIAGIVSAPFSASGGANGKSPVFASPLPQGAKSWEWGWSLPALIGLAFSLTLLHSAQTIDAAKAQIAAHEPVPADTSVWPPDPNLLYWTGKPDEAARIEPSSRRYFQWARVLEHDGREVDAIPLFQKARLADPNNLQTLRALAEAQEKTGDTSGALQTWREMIRRYEGPAGQIRAIPELPETFPAFAYTAVARSAEAAGDRNQAIFGYDKAAEVIEAYSQTPPAYQQMELASAVMSGVDLLGRRREVRELYQRIVRDMTALEAQKADTINRRAAETLARLDAFAKPDSIGKMPAGP